MRVDGGSGFVSTALAGGEGVQGLSGSLGRLGVQFEHEVWDHTKDCPVHPDNEAHADRVGKVTVVVTAGDGNDGNDGNDGQRR